MATRNEKRVASARQRLRHMERLIGPYSEPDTPQKPTARREWIPGDSLVDPGNITVAAQKIKQKAAV